MASAIADDEGAWIAKALTLAITISLLKASLLFQTRAESTGDECRGQTRQISAG
ncbi:hypothetical protein NMD73_08850 [Edwardsiella tarda]